MHRTWTSQERDQEPRLHQVKVTAGIQGSEGRTINVSLLTSDKILPIKGKKKNTHLRALYLPYGIRLRHSTKCSEPTHMCVRNVIVAEL